MLMYLLEGAANDVLPWASGGTAGLLGLTLYFYRQDRKDSREKLVNLLDRYDRHLEDFREIVERNSSAITKLTVVVERINGAR